MCTLVILRRPDHRWPVVIAANRDEMADRPWRGPARHWPDRPHVVGGYDALAGGTWLALNDDGVCAAVLNRIGTLGPARDKRSRGELPLEALEHADAVAAATALAALDTSAYRAFNLVVADNRDAYWLMSTGSGRVVVRDLDMGVSMITSRDLNDRASPRIAAFLDRFRAAPAPDVAAGDWFAWQALLANRDFDPVAGPREAMNVATDCGYGTVSSSLVALPAVGRAAAGHRWLFAAGRPDEAPFEPVASAA